MSSNPYPSPTPVPTPQAGPTPVPTPQAGPTPVPTPQAGPTAVHTLHEITLPDIPTNTWTLLSDVADAIDTATSSFRTRAGNISDITTDVTTAINAITSTSKGDATDALVDLWGNTKTDLNRGHDPLTAIIAATALGGTPNPLREALDQHQLAIQNGITAMEEVEQARRSSSDHPPSPQQIEAWIEQIHDLTNALGNVAMALQLMTLEIRNINGGFSTVCATGLVPGHPLPTFTRNAFASQNTTGGSKSEEITADDLEKYLASQGVDQQTAFEISAFAVDQGLNLDDIKAMFVASKDPQQIYQWLENETLYKWMYDGKPGRSLNDITALLKQDVNGDTMTQLLNGHADLKEISSDVPLLMKQGGTDVNQIALRLKDMNSDQLEVLKNRIVQNKKISANDAMQLVDPQLEYDPNPKHAKPIPDFIGPEPKNGQAALNNSVSVKDVTTNRRIGIDPSTGEIVVLDDTNIGQYHGHVRTWDQLSQQMKNALVDDGLIDKRGRIILRDSQGKIDGYGKKVGSS